jgi:ribose transport system permease protein
MPEIENRKARKKEIFAKLFGSRAFTLLILLIVLGFVLSLAHDRFLYLNNIFNVTRQISLIVLLAIGATLVLVTGCFDLSVGAIVGFSAVVLAAILQAGGNSFFAIAGGLACGAAIGLINGLLITKLRINPFIVTLGMMSIVRGTIMTITRGTSITFVNPVVGFLGQGYIGPIPIPVLIMVFFVIVFHIIYKKTVFGNHIKATGGNPEAARISGINIDRNRIIVLIISGTLAALAGIVFAGRINTGQPHSGLGWELDAIAAAIVGGTSLSGGVGSIIGALLGAAVIGVLSNGMILLNISSFLQPVITGLLLISVVALDELKQKGSLAK